MRHQAPPVTAPSWTPYTTDVWTTKQLAAWYDKYGEWCFYNGRAYTPKVKRLGAGRHAISWKLMEWSN